MNWILPITNNQAGIALILLGTILMLVAAGIPKNQYSKAKKEIKQVVKRATKNGLFAPAESHTNKWLLALGLILIVAGSILQWISCPD